MTSLALGTHYVRDVITPRAAKGASQLSLRKPPSWVRLVR